MTLAIDNTTTDIVGFCDAELEDGQMVQRKVRHHTDFGDLRADFSLDMSIMRTPLPVAPNRIALGKLKQFAIAGYYVDDGLHRDMLFSVWAPIAPIAEAIAKAVCETVDDYRHYSNLTALPEGSEP